MTRRLRLATDPYEVAVRTLSPAALRCRDLGHHWSPHTARWSGSDAAYVQTHRCDLCGAERDRLVRRDGTLASGSRYRYPAAYLAVGVSLATREGHAAVRRATMTDLIRRGADTA
jgi:hypothetical protein